MDKALVLILGGSAGTLARFYLGAAVHQWWGVRFPYGTLTVNLLGCFMIGFFLMAGEKWAWNANVSLLLIVGFCGAFTTFSTFILDISHLIRTGHTMLAFINVMASVAAGFALFKLGMVLGKLI